MFNLTKKIDSCKKCPLHLKRKNSLIGDGNLKAKIMIIGEAPGYHEDLQKKAFVGQAGKILDQLLKHINLLRKDIYITNILKCHPPNNQNPKPSEIHACIGYLYEQIKIIKPEFIVTLGKFASLEIFSKVSLKFSKISEMHGKIFKIKASYGLVKIIPLYHPSIACYNISMLDTLKNDFENSLGIFLKNKNYENNNSI